ncbi:hypothetical protein H9Q72_008440 [Fusarium xylarioides]|uniref:Uncharacterized protein n=1 Tax=Fusarium xylarioides TaxID=221167 RepID=A0A9P7HNC7_9HYPO|nr:hypothetical protein H9Q70_005573 [Fusarium xylarioides]KAG5763450.1 hypothetical protein H9Q72_008440 [Fusarium xylarioides]
MEIPFDPLPSSKEGWSSGLEFFKELDAWTHKYEQEVARPTATNDQYVRVYVDSAVSKLPGFVAVTIRKVLAESLDDIMRTSLCLEPPGLLLSAFIKVVRTFRITYLRYMALPRSRPIRLVAEQPNPGTTHFNFDQLSFQPWYVKPNFRASWGPVALLLRSFGGKVPSWSKERYQPQGYDLMTIGPDPQKGKGVEEMVTAVGVIKARGVATCPFSQGLGS